MPCSYKAITNVFICHNDETDMMETSCIVFPRDSSLTMMQNKCLVFKILIFLLFRYSLDLVKQVKWHLFK